MGTFAYPNMHDIRHCACPTGVVTRVLSTKAENRCEGITKERTSMKMELNSFGNTVDKPILPPPESLFSKSVPHFHAISGIGTKRVLVIDETKETGRLLQGAFSDAGHAVTSMADGEECLPRLSETGFDLVIIGGGSSTDGWSLARLLKERFPDVPVLMIACMGREGVIEKMKEKRVDFLVYKPFFPEDLRQMVEIILFSKPF
jgi:CheY-like chemotaxis protein